MNSRGQPVFALFGLIYLVIVGQIFQENLSKLGIIEQAALLIGWFVFTFGVPALIAIVWDKTHKPKKRRKKNDKK